ncbi:MAG: acyl carrier protein [Clostridia bacterium]|nr:acyl carrier protein [Clostridia bacterium]
MFEKVKNLLVEELSIDESGITLDAKLTSDLGINSLELADLILVCEDKFNIVIDDEDLNTLLTVGDIVNYLESKVNE